MAFIFTLFCVLSIATITTQYKVLRDTGNDTDIFKLIKLLQDIADRASLSSDELIDINTFGIITDDDDDPRHDDTNYDNWEDEKDDYIQKPQNILRWLPKRHYVKVMKTPEEIAAQRAEVNKQRAIEQNAARAEYVVNAMKKNYLVTLYLWGEVSRILKEKQIFDEMREMIHTVEQEGNEQLKESVLKCYKEVKQRSRDVLWDDKKTNNLVINHVRHPDHDGGV